MREAKHWDTCCIPKYRCQMVVGYKTVAFRREAQGKGANVGVIRVEGALRFAYG